MSGTKMKCVFYLLMAIAVVGFAGCILNPTEEVPKDKPVVVYRDLTDKEDVPYNLVQCYNEANLNRYMELLYDQYDWHNQDLDVKDGKVPKQINTRDEEITTHEKFFRAAKRGYTEDPTLNIDKLDLVIATGQPDDWQLLPDFEGAPCEDCWETTRMYTITVQFQQGSKVLVGEDLVRLVIIGVPKDGKTYYHLRAAYDISSN